MSKKDLRLTGRFPLAYMGVDPEATPFFLTEKRDPGIQDKYNFHIGDVWLNSSELKVWILVSLDENKATWINIIAIDASIYNYITNSGTAIPVDRELNIYGDGGVMLYTAASGNTVSINMTYSIDGKIIIGSTTVAADWADISSTGGTVMITRGPSSINIESAGIPGVRQFTSDSGIALPISGVIYCAGGDNIVTSASGSTLTVSLEDDVTIAGTLTLSYASAGICTTNASGLISSSNGSDGQTLIGGGTAPAWANITSTGGTIAITNGANSINLETGSAPPPSGTDSCFLAFLPGTNNYTYYPFGTAWTIGVTGGVSITEIYDNNNDLSTNGIFTAPVTGKYHLQARLRYKAYSTLASLGYYRRLTIYTSNRLYTDYRAQISPSAGVEADTKENICTIEVVADMDMGDTATYVFFWQSVLTTTPSEYNCDIIGGNSSAMETYISGCIIDE